MSRKNKRRATKDTSTVGKCATDNIQEISREAYVEMQAEAYYRALKRLDEEKAERSREEAQSVVKKKWYVKMKEFSIIVFLPWIAEKIIKSRTGFYNSILSLGVTWVMVILGSFLWMCGIVELIKCIGGLSSGWDKVAFIPWCFIVVLVGVIFILSGMSFSKETDNEKIRSFSASFWLWLVL